MSIIFRGVLVYFLLSLATMALLYGNLERAVYEAVVTGAVNVTILTEIGFWIAPLLVFSLVIVGWRILRSRLAAMIVVVVSTVFLHMGFAFFKNAIPELIPYYADPVLAAADRWLHAGVDPWRIFHDWLPPEWGRRLVVVYLMIWMIPALTFPVLLMVFDRNHDRVSRYVWLYFCSWIVLGNVWALAGSSVGPVYYDRLLGGDRFQDLMAALQASGITQSPIGLIQEALWRRFEGGMIELGLGISAFPSMHVAIAALTALYLTERSLWLAPVGVVFLGVIFFMSVYTGYHYALDGYFSIAAVLLGNRLLVRHQNRVSQARTMQSIAA